MDCGFHKNIIHREAAHRTVAGNADIQPRQRPAYRCGGDWLAKAFDWVNHNILCHYEVRNENNNWSSCFLQDKWHRGSCASEFIRVKSGLPQGLVWGHAYFWSTSTRCISGLTGASYFWLTRLLADDTTSASQSPLQMSTRPCSRAFRRWNSEGVNGTWFFTQTSAVCCPSPKAKHHTL